VGVERRVVLGFDPEADGEHAKTRKKTRNDGDTISRK
jgi:hypothetical protein